MLNCHLLFWYEIYSALDLVLEETGFIYVLLQIVILVYQLRLCSTVSNKK